MRTPCKEVVSFSTWTRPTGDPFTEWTSVWTTPSCQNKNILAWGMWDRIHFPVWFTVAFIHLWSPCFPTLKCCNETNPLGHRILSSDVSSVSSLLAPACQHNHCHLTNNLFFIKTNKQTKNQLILLCTSGIQVSVYLFLLFKLYFNLMCFDVFLP